MRSYEKLKKADGEYLGQDYVASIYASKTDLNLMNFYFDDKNEAIEFAKKTDLEPYQYLEVWEKDEKGNFGNTGEPLFRKERSR